MECAALKREKMHCCVSTTTMKLRVRQESRFKRKERRQISATICKLLAELVLVCMAKSCPSTLKNQALGENGGQRKVDGQITHISNQLKSLQ